VRAREISEIVNAEPDLVQVCKKLIDRANEAGGPDNITVVAARFDGAGLVEAGAEAVEHRVYRGSQETRATVPVDRSSVPGLSAMSDDDQAEIPTLETDKITPDKIIVGTAKTTAPTAKIAPDAREELRRRVEAKGRVPKDLLRAVFGAIFALVLVFYLIRWIRG
jgi:hypothetical protein